MDYWIKIFKIEKSKFLNFFPIFKKKISQSNSYLNNLNTIR